MRAPKTLPVIFTVLFAALIAASILFLKNRQPDGVASEPVTAVTSAPVSPTPVETTSPTPIASPTDALATPSPQPSGTATPATAANVDLSVDPSGLSTATAVVKTEQGVIKFKFYPADAPNTVHRIVELIQQGFYNGTIFHRVVPGFVVQGGDPTGTGTGGSGKNLKAEFNKRKHIEGAVGLARASDPDSGDSQFYISLGTHPHLDNSYTVFGQVIEGMDVARKIRKGDKMLSVTIQ